MSSNLNIWKNSDGLNVMFGTTQALKAPGGSPASAGQYKEIVYDFDYNDLAAVGTTDQFLNQGMPNIFVPAGALLVSSVLQAVVGFDSASSDMTLTLGMSKRDGSVIDNDGIDVAIAKTAIDGVGESVTNDGALIGTILAFDSYVTATVLVHSATAGQGRLVLRYFVPPATT